MLEELIKQCIKNDRQAQSQLYKYLYGKMFAICRSYIPDYDIAANVMNDAFLKVFTNIEKYTNKGSFEGWVKKIVINTAIDNIRCDKKYKEQIYLDERIEEKDLYFNEEEFNEIDIEEIYKMVEILPLASRTVFNLYVFEGLNHIEIGKKLQISVGTSKWHLSTARQKLRELITEKNIVFNKVYE